MRVGIIAAVTTGDDMVTVIRAASPRRNLRGTMPITMLVMTGSTTDKDNHPFMDSHPAEGAGVMEGDITNIFMLLAVKLVG